MTPKGTDHPRQRPSELLARLDLAARRERVPRSVLFRELLADGLDRLEAAHTAAIS